MCIVFLRDSSFKWRPPAPEPLFLAFWGWEGSIQDESGLEGTYFAPAGRLRQESTIFVDIQKVQTLDS